MSTLEQDSLDTVLPRDRDPQDLSEAQLRQLYEQEEVDRLISFFSAYVTEFRISPKVSGAESDLDVTAGGGASARRPNSVDHALSEHIAYHYLLPYLPPAPSVPPTFTLKRLGLTTQRLYLALFPVYQTFLLDLAHLALWKDYQRSLRYCIMFWFLWFHDLLLPVLVFRIVFGLLRRRLSTYPTLKELQERRQETAQALRFSEAVQQRLAVSTLGPTEMWHLFKLYKSGGKGEAQLTEKNDEWVTDNSAVTSFHLVETEEEESLRRGVLHIMIWLADVHERIKNIFMWRRPDVSRRYLFFFIVIGFGTLILPARYVAKVVYWLGGTLFWHVTPIIAALPQADKIRASLLLINAPTDADYAMELIAKRIAAGQDVGTTSLRNEPYRTPNASSSTESFTRTLYGTYVAQSSEDDGINWKRWSERVAHGKSFVEEGRRLWSSQTSLDQDFQERAPAVNGSSQGGADAHSFLAQYASSSGLITLTPSTLFFTSLIRTNAKLIVPRDRLRGVRRSGLMKGLCITWVPEGLADGEEKEEKFHWVGNRDELFARLVGTDGGRWMRV